MAFHRSSRRTEISLSVNFGFSSAVTELAGRAVDALESLAASSANSQLNLEDAVTDLSALTDATTAVAALIGDVGQKLTDYLADVNTTLDELRAQVAEGDLDEAAINTAVENLRATIAPLNDMRDELVEASNDDENEVPPIVVPEPVPTDETPAPVDPDAPLIEAEDPNPSN